MNKEENFKNLYLGQWLPNRFETYSTSELLDIEKSKFSDPEDKKTAKRIRIKREEIEINKKDLV